MASRKRPAKAPSTVRRSYGAPRYPFVNLSSDWYWEQDADLRFTHVQIGDEVPPEELALAKNLIGLRRWETGIEVEGGWQAHRALLEARKPFRDVLMWRAMEDGSRRYISTSGRPVLDEKGAFAGYHGVGRNVTEQKRAEARLQASESRLRAIVDNEPECVKLLDARGNLLDMNPAGLRMIEADDLAPLRGQCIYGLVAAAHLEAFRELVRRVVGGEEQSLEFEMIGLKGTRRWMEVRAVPLRDQAGGETLMLAITRDITARKSAETQLRESEARFRALTEMSSDWYWETDGEHRFTRLEGRNVAGQDSALAARLVGARRWDSGMECEGGWRAHRAALDAHDPFYNVLMWRKSRDGRLRYVRVSGEPMFDAAGGFVGYRGVGREVTEEKRAELLLRLEHEVARALAAAGDAGNGVRAVLRAICQGEGLPAGRYFALDEAAGVMRFTQAWHVSDPDIERFVEGSAELAYREGQGLTGAVWQSGEPRWTADVQNDPRANARPLAEATGIRGVFAFPALAEGKVLGVLTFSSKEAREPDERLLQTARVVGSQVGQFLSGKRAEESLRESEARFRSLTQMSSDFFWETDEQHRLTEITHGPGYRPLTQAAIGKTSWELPSVSPDEVGWTAHRATYDAHRPFRDFEIGRATPEGTRYLALSGEPRFDAAGRFLGYRGVGRDVTEIALARERIATLAYSDPLTGLANRASLGPSLEQAVQRSRRRNSKLAVVFLDLDGFKEVNDLHGHDAGDALLVEVAERLRTHLRASDLVARLGGDEFLVVLEEVQDLAPVETVAKKLLGEMRRPFAVPGAEAVVTASIGISVFPDDAADGTALMKHADSAMYAAKQAGKNCLAFYSAGPAANETADSVVPAQAGTHGPPLSRG
jgi:diguanylate cyclase (GGDEF)-like protein/PAS domain S-box-containing protein